jgi:deoxycytidylate deaminase
MRYERKTFAISFTLCLAMTAGVLFGANGVLACEIHVKKTGAAGSKRSQAKAAPHFKRESDLEVLLRTYALAMTGMNQETRFASVIKDRKTDSFVIHGSWNRLSEKLERKRFSFPNLEPRLPDYAWKLMEENSDRKIHNGVMPPSTGALSLDVSVHAEQAALVELIETYPEVLAKNQFDAYNLYTIPVDGRGRIGVVNQRQWTCFRCSLWLNVYPINVYEIFPDGFEVFLPNREILESVFDGAEKLSHVPGESEGKDPVYRYYYPDELLIDPKFSLSKLTQKFSETEQKVFNAALEAAKKGSFNWKRVMSFGSVLVRGEEIISTGTTRGELSSEEVAVERALKKGESLKGLSLYTLGVSPLGNLALVNPKKVACRACKKIQEEGVTLFEWSDSGFEKATYVKAPLSEWAIAGKGYSRATNPFSYRWISGP